MKTTDITDNMVRLMSKADRKRLGFKTREEAISEAEIKSERDLHKQIGNLLRLRGIVFFESRMDKKTTRKKGEPDFLFSVAILNGPPTNTIAVPCAWECKTGSGQLSDDQKAVAVKLTTFPNHWRFVVIRSVDEALAELKRMGL